MKPVADGLIGLVMVVSLLLPAGCQKKSEPAPAKEKVVFFNGKDFSGWKLFVEGEDVDAADIFTVKDGVVNCKGKPNGYMRTEAEYKNYNLHLEWRWVDEPANSGVLLHSSGKDQVWPRTIECQLKAGSAGDFVLINGTGVTVDGEDKQNTEKQYVVVEKKNPSNEKEAGQWNTYDIECRGDTIRCTVNGLLQNEGTNATDTSGWICLQSEGSEIEFRNIYIEPLE